MGTVICNGTSTLHIVFTSAVDPDPYWIRMPNTDPDPHMTHIHYTVYIG